MCVEFLAKGRRLGWVAAALSACWIGGCAAQRGVHGHEFYRTLRAASVSVLVDGRMHGSGFFATPDGLVVTAAHVVKGHPANVELLSASLGRLPARIVAVDASHDAAVLAPTGGRREYPALQVSPRPPAPGEPVYLIGNPLFRHNLLLSGTVASDAPTYCYSRDLLCYTRVVYISGSSPKGSSGGCWVDSRGRVVGVQSGYLGPNKTSAGLATVGYPDGLIRLLSGRKSITVATLGSQLDELWSQPPGFIARFPKGTRGIVTVRPHTDGPVAKAGLNKESLITAIDGRAVQYCDELLDAVRAKAPGQTVTLTVMDPDRKATRKVVVRLEAIAQ